jgi:hypothetical protein
MITINCYHKGVYVIAMILKNYFFQGWKLYDSGPKSVKVPLVCLPPVSGTAEVFFRQILALCAKGIRVLAVRIFYTTFVLTCPSEEPG